MTALTDDGLQTVGHLLHEFPRARRAQRTLQFLIARRRRNHAQILRNGAGDHGVPLRHIGKAAAQRGVHRHLAPVPSTQKRPPAPRRDQAEHRADHRRLAAAGRADQRDDLPRLRAEGDAAQHPPLALIGKAHLLHHHAHAVRRFLQQLAALRQHRLRRKLRQLADSVRGDGRAQKRRHGLDEGVERGCQLRALREKERHRAVENFARPQQVQAVEKRGHLHHRPEDREQRLRLDAEEVVVETHRAIGLLLLAQARAVAIRHAEALDGVEIAQRLRLIAHELAAAAAHVLVIAAQPPKQPPRCQQQKRRTRKRQHRHHPVIVKDHRERRDECIERDHEIRQPADGVSRDGARVAAEPVEQVAARESVQCAPVGAEDAVEHLSADVVVHAQRDARRDARDSAAQQQAAHRRGDHQHQQHPQPRGLIARDDVDGVFPRHSGHQTQR